MSSPPITILPDEPSEFPAPPLPPWKRNGNINSNLASSPDILTRISAFLPHLQAANASLEAEIASGKIAEKRIDNVGEDEEEYIEMNLGLGVLEEKKPRRNASDSKSGRKRVKRSADGQGADICDKANGKATAKKKGVLFENEGDEEISEAEDSCSSSSSCTESESGTEDSTDSSNSDNDDSDPSSSSSDPSDSGSATSSEDEAEIDSDEEMADSDLVSAFLGSIGKEIASETLLPDPSQRKRKRGQPDHKQKGVLAALLNIDGYGQGGSASKAESKKPVIEVVGGDDHGIEDKRDGDVGNGNKSEGQA